MLNFPSKYSFITHKKNGVLLTVVKHGKPVHSVFAKYKEEDGNKFIHIDVLEHLLDYTDDAYLFIGTLESDKDLREEVNYSKFANGDV